MDHQIATRAPGGSFEALTINSDRTTSYVVDAGALSASRCEYLLDLLTDRPDLSPKRLLRAMARARR
jgi:hypothetical protein